MPPRSAYALAPRTLALRALVGISGEDPETRTCWIDVAGPGEWKGHPAGPFTLDAAAFASCIAAFDAQANPIVVDYDHASLAQNADGGAPAAGWVQALEMRGDRLYAQVEWCEDTAAMIRAGKFRYCSGVFVFDEPDRETGASTVCVLDSIALTNRPFIDGQKPIALTRVAQLELPTMPETENKTEDAGAMLAARLMEATGIADVAALLAAMDANLPAVVAALKGAKAEVEVEAPMAAPTAPAVPASDVAALTAQVAALTTQVKSQADELRPLREAAAHAADVALVAEVEAAVSAGKIHPAAREQFTALARANPSSFRSLAAALPASLPQGPGSAPVIVPPSQSASVDKDAKRRELTTRYSARSWGLSAAQVEATVTRELAALYPEN